MAGATARDRTALVAVLYLGGWVLACGELDRAAVAADARSSRSRQGTPSNWPRSSASGPTSASPRGGARQRGRRRLARDLIVEIDMRPTAQTPRRSPEHAGRTGEGRGGRTPSWPPRHRPSPDPAAGRARPAGLARDDRRRRSRTCSTAGTSSRCAAGSGSLTWRTDAALRRSKLLGDAEQASHLAGVALDRARRGRGGRRPRGRGSSPRRVPVPAGACAPVSRRSCRASGASPGCAAQGLSKPLTSRRPSSSRPRRSRCTCRPATASWRSRRGRSCRRCSRRDDRSEAEVQAQGCVHVGHEARGYSAHTAPDPLDGDRAHLLGLHLRVAR